MKYEAGEYVAIHRSPIWRDRSNFLLRARIGADGGKSEWEQLWGQQTAPRRFILCCIPFFVRDLDLGDELETNDDYVFSTIIHRSGQITFRIWFGEQRVESKTQVTAKLEDMNALMEWSSEHYLAVSAQDRMEAERIADYLQNCEERDLLQYETGRTA